MAIIHQAELSPSKIDLLRAWLPGCSWWQPDAVPITAVEAVGAYRFDDPEGEVGLETHLLSTGPGAAQLLQVPLTYRAAPLAGAEEALVGTMQHSVLGERWVYDGCHDPVFVSALVTAIVTGGEQAPMMVVLGPTSADPIERPPTTRVTGTGSPTDDAPPVGVVSVSERPGCTVIRSGDLEVVLRRVLGSDASRNDEPLAGRPTLIGTWPGTPEPALLAWVNQA